MKPRKPPFFDGAIARTCTRRLGNHDCGKEPVRHVIWDEECENGFVCQTHLAELGTVWAFLAAHEVGPDCAMPGSMFFFEENVCRCEGDLEPAAEIVEAVGVVV
jgi:hypothetical protein